jgi:hypothetical protein
VEELMNKTNQPTLVIAFENPAKKRLREAIREFVIRVQEHCQAVGAEMPLAVQVRLDGRNDKVRWLYRVCLPEIEPEPGILKQSEFQAMNQTGSAFISTSSERDE